MWFCLGILINSAVQSSEKVIMAMIIVLNFLRVESDGQEFRSVNLGRLAIYWPGCVFWAFLWLLPLGLSWIFSTSGPCLTCILLVKTELLYHTVRSRTGQKHCVKQQWPPSIFLEFLSSSLSSSKRCFVNNGLEKQPEELCTDV